MDESIRANSKEVELRLSPLIVSDLHFLFPSISLSSSSLPTGILSIFSDFV